MCSGRPKLPRNLLLAILITCLFETVWTFEPHSNRLWTGTITVESEIYIRDSHFADLEPVSDLMVQAFHNHPSSTTRHHYRMEELNRLRLNFPGDDKSQLRLLVAVEAKNDDILGFCMIENRPAPPSTYFVNNPRPMLSDLVVALPMRRKGIAKQLVNVCETICWNDFNSQALYLRVLENNEVARKMYQTLGYQYVENAGERPELLLLRKDLSGAPFTAAAAITQQPTITTTVTTPATAETNIPPAIEPSPPPKTKKIGQILKVDIFHPEPKKKR